MCVSIVRRAFTVATLFAVSACSAAPSGPLSPAAQGPSATSSLVHRGVPVMRAPALLPDALRSAFPQTYPAGGLLLFAGDSSLQAIEIYKAGALGKNSAPIASITDGIYCPYGMAFDSSGTLYVASNCGRNTITEYPKGQTTHSTEITSGISNPLGVVIDKKGTLYVANYPASITEYPSGSTTPSVTITSNLLRDPFGLALDKSGNLYIADFGSSNVFEVPAGTTTVQSLNLQDITEPLNLAFDKAGNLWVTDGEGDKVNVYPPGSTTPSQSITSGYVFPYQLTSDAKGTVVASNQADPAQIYAYKPGQYTPYGTLTNDVKLTTGLLLAKP